MPTLLIRNSGGKKEKGREGLTLFFHEFHRKHKRAGTKTSLSWSEEWKLCAEGSAGRLASAALCCGPFLQSGRSVYKVTSDTRMETTAGFYKVSTSRRRSFPRLKSRVGRTRRNIRRQKVCQMALRWMNQDLLAISH